MYNFSFFIFLFRYPYSLYKIYATSVSISYPIYISAPYVLCVCPFPVYVPSCACPLCMYLVHVPTICVSSPCVCPFVLLFFHIRSLRVYVPHMCMSLHVHVPSVRISAPFLCPLRGYVSLRVYVGIVVPFRVCSFVLLSSRWVCPSVSMSLRGYVLLRVCPCVSMSLHGYAPPRVFACVCPFVCTRLYMYPANFSTTCLVDTYYLPAPAPSI